MRVWWLSLFLISAPALAVEWLPSSSLKDLQELSADDRRRISQIVKSKIISYSLEDPETRWSIHRGDLLIPGNFDHAGALVVDGNLEIAGSYDDNGDGLGLLIVLGNLKADHVLSWSGLYVRGALEAKGIVFGYYNDYAFEVDGGVSARGIVMDDHSASYQVTRADFEIDNSSMPSPDQLAIALAQLEPDLLAHPDHLELDESSDLYSLWPAYDATQALVHQGKPIFRTQAAAPRLIADLGVAIAPESGESQLLALIGRDPLVDRVIAARMRLGQKLIDALLARKDAGVRAWLARHVTDLGKLGGIEALTVKTAERLIENPETSEATLLEIGRAPNPDLRRTLALRENLPSAVIAVVARDGDSSVRANILRNFGNADRLTASEQARLARDLDPEVRAAIAASDLPAEVATVLAKDESQEVRLQLAFNLAAQVDRPYSRSTLEERERIAEMLVADPQEEVASAVFVALPPARQAAIYRDRALDLDWRTIAQSTRSVELMKALSEVEADLEIQGNLAENLALPIDLQLLIVARAHKLKKCSACFLHEDTDAVLAALLENENAAPAALIAASRLALERPTAGFIDALKNQRSIPPEALERLDVEWRGGEDWALSVILMQHASRAMLEWALPLWYEEEDIEKKAIDGMRRLDDSAWWRALAVSKIEQLREVAAGNVHTPPELLIALIADSSDEASANACGNPRLPPGQDVLQKKGLAAAIHSPQTSLEELAEYSRSAPSRDLQLRALEVYTQRKLRAWP